jgi:hypothetical protein
VKNCAAVKTGSRHDKTYLTWNSPRKKILTEKCYVKVLNMCEPARPAVENWAMGVLHRWLESLADPSKLFITRGSGRENKDSQKSTYQFHQIARSMFQGAPGTQMRTIAHRWKRLDTVVPMNPNSGMSHANSKINLRITSNVC